MVKVMPREIEQQLTGLSRAVVHAEKLFQRGVITHDELENVRTFALEQRFGPLMDTETYVKARENGDFEAYEALLSDPRSGTAARREMAMRKAAASYVAEQALEYQPKSQEEQNWVMKNAREKMATLVDMSDEDADNDFAVYQKHAKLTLGDEVRKPVEEPSWAKPLQRLSDDDPDVKAFKLRDENTSGTRRFNAATDIYGEKRDSKGRYIPKNVLREDADRIPTRKNSTFEEDVKRVKSEYDDTRGYTVDHEYGVRTAGEAAEIERYEQGQRDNAAAAEASPTPPSDPGPTILPNPSDA